MFKIPDWEEDIPKSTVHFEKRVKRKKENVPTKTPQIPKKIEVLNKKTVPKANKIIAQVSTLPKANNYQAKVNGLPKASSKVNVKGPHKNNNLKAKNYVQISAKNNNDKEKNYDQISAKDNHVKAKNYVQISTKNEQDVKVNNKTQNDKNTRKRKLESQPVNTKNTTNKSDESDNFEIQNLDLEKADEVLLNAKKKKLNEAYKIKSEDSLFGKKKKLKQLLERNRSSIVVSGDKLRQRMLERLKAAQFRYLNEKLYTSSGSEAKELFQSDPTAFQTYHQGYQQQLKKWPVNPLDVIVKKILKMPKTHIIADMGCGEAALAKRVPHSVRSFDLVATAPGVEVCDMAHTPLLAASIDVAVYCLALMGTELTQYVVEANRILKQGGHLLIAEVESRFENVESFARDIEKLGFKLKSIDKNKVFFFLQFVKNRDPPKKGKPELSLKPCLYKKR